MPYRGRKVSEIEIGSHWAISGERVTVLSSAVKKPTYGGQRGTRVWTVQTDAGNLISGLTIDQFNNHWDLFLKRQEQSREQAKLFAAREQRCARVGKRLFGTLPFLSAFRYDSQVTFTLGVEAFELLEAAQEQCLRDDLLAIERSLDGAVGNT